MAVQCGFTGDPVSLVRWGPTLGVRVGFDPAYDPGPQGRLAQVPDRKYLALVDTGATLSAIDSSLAVDLNLPAIDRERISGVGGKQDFNVYMAQIFVPSLDIEVYGKFHGVHLRDGGQPYQAILGRSFLEDFHLTYEGQTGSVMIRRSTR